MGSIGGTHEARKLMFIPQIGDRVRILEVSPLDCYFTHKGVVGATGTVSETPFRKDENTPWIQVDMYDVQFTDGTREEEVCFYECKVEVMP